MLASNIEIESLLNRTSRSKLGGTRIGFKVPAAARSQSVHQVLGRRPGPAKPVVRANSSVTARLAATPLMLTTAGAGSSSPRMYQYDVPVLDLGVELQSGQSDGGRVTWLAPGVACLWCQEILSVERVRAEQLSPSARGDELVRGLPASVTDEGAAHRLLGCDVGDWMY